MQTIQKDKPDLSRERLNEIVEKCVNDHIREMEEFNKYCIESKLCTVSSPIKKPSSLNKKYYKNLHEYLSKNYNISA